eukprot:TRINITY_DN7965_c0_g1_i1.p4 TRINITY_DN7965_c0_g1~~TRINITY_DN7965_c0_g1_i1.p4  ORF type:complete len:106 (+),score=46.63 TRINITY_DN7965_c0_g1_i1:64-381(+)
MGFQKMEQKNEVAENKPEISVNKPKEEISEELLDEIKTAFKMFDENGDETIDEHELKRIMLTLGLDATAEEVKDLMNTVDKDGSCLLYTSPSPRDLSTSRMPSSA